MLLTDPSVKRQIPPQKGQQTYFDDSVRGFGLRVSAGGTKSFVLIVGRNRKRITIGRYPDISLKEARTRAREIIAERVLGRDDLPPLKFGDAIPIFLASHYGDNYLKPRTKQETERLLRRHFEPTFRYSQVAEVRTHEIAKIIDGLRKTPAIARTAFAAIRLFYRWAEGRRYVDRSPCAIMKPPRPSLPRERVLSKAELKAVLTTARAEPGTFSTIVELLVLTGQRRGEIAALRDDWINWERRTITFPAKVAKNKRQHTIPFGSRTEELLRKGSSAGCLFLGRCRTTPFDGWSKCKPKFDRRCGDLSPWSLHDLRRTFATNLAALGVQVQVTEKLLNHVSGTMGGIVSVYQRHSYAKEMREAVELWERTIAEFMCEPARRVAGDATQFST
jgi:integrase